MTYSHQDIIDILEGLSVWVLGASVLIGLLVYIGWCAHEEHDRRERARKIKV